MKRTTIILSLFLSAIGVFAQNPIITTAFSADPTARVFNDRVYVFPSHDINPPAEFRRQDWFCMADYHVYSSDNLTDWVDHGVILDQENVEWGNKKAFSMWAPDCVEKNGRYYFYFPNAPESGFGFKVGVAIANNPAGPYRPMLRPMEGVNGIDPCVLQASDGNNYIFYGGGQIQVAKLASNMMAIEGTPQRITGLPSGFVEGPFAFEYNGKYYLTYPWVRKNTETLAYAMSDNPMGPYEYKGLIMEESPTGCWTNHHSIVNFKGQWYLFYHHNDFSPNMDKRRSVRADSLNFNPDGTIQLVRPTLRGIGVTRANSRIQIDRYSSINDDAKIDFLNPDTTKRFEGWKTIFTKKGAAVNYNTVDLTGSFDKVQVMVNSKAGGELTIGIDGPKGQKLAKVTIPKKDGWQLVSAPVKNLPSGIHNLYVELSKGTNVEVDWLIFGELSYDKGGFTTRQYRNYFLEMGYSQKEIDAKVQEAFDNVFTGPHKCYFEVGDSMAYISDVKNNDVRTEGMSYGMMIAVQFDRQDIFNRLWKWTSTYMQHHDGALKGYFAWSCRTDGTRNSQGPASDGELYYVTSLIFASNRWGDSGEINYLAEAQNIINCSFQKVGMDNTAPLINLEHKIISFTPDPNGITYTDPSYNIPAFYEVWARWLKDGRSNFWMACADSARAYLHRSINPQTGLNDDYNNFDGSPRRGFGGFGFGFGGFGGNGGNGGGVPQGVGFRYDSWRVPMNIALDYSWSCADREWQNNYANTIQNFLYKEGVKTFVDQYTTDGKRPANPMRAGSFPPALRHAMGFVATSAAVSLAATDPKSKEFVQQLWETPHEPLEDGFFDEYYDALLRLFAFMHLSGKYQVIFPK